jgi:hypothetical protein
LAVLAGLFTLVTACGGPADDGDGVASISETNTPSSSAAKGKDGETDIDQIRAYTKCMREHGIDMKDPEPDPGGGGSGGIGISVDGASDKAKVDKANAACKHLMPNGGEPEKPSAEQLDEARKTAKCLREHGIDVKDPTMDDPGISISGEAGDDQEKVDKAMQECMPEGAKTEKHQSNEGGGK